MIFLNYLYRKDRNPVLFLAFPSALHTNFIFNQIPTSYYYSTFCRLHCRPLWPWGCSIQVLSPVRKQTPWEWIVATLSSQTLHKWKQHLKPVEEYFSDPFWTLNKRRGGRQRPRNTGSTGQIILWILLCCIMLGHCSLKIWTTSGKLFPSRFLKHEKVCT